MLESWPPCLGILERRGTTRGPRLRQRKTSHTEETIDVSSTAGREITTVGLTPQEKVNRRRGCTAVVARIGGLGEGIDRALNRIGLKYREEATEEILKRDWWWS